MSKTESVDFRNFLVEYFDGCANQREHWAKEQGDSDSVASADALGRLAKHVRGLQADDNRFVRLREAFVQEEIDEGDHLVLASWLEPPDSAGIPLGQRTDPAAIALRYGYRSEPADPDEFLTDFVGRVASQLPEIFNEWH